MNMFVCLGKFMPGVMVLALIFEGSDYVGYFGDKMYIDIPSTMPLCLRL